MKLLKEHGRHQQVFCRLQGSISTLVKKEQKKRVKKFHANNASKKNLDFVYNLYFDVGSHLVFGISYL